jgi:hypothetical protein
MPRSRTAKHQTQFLKWFPTVAVILGAIISLVAATIGYTAWVTKNVAQIDYVNEALRKQVDYINLKADLQKAYTDAQSALLRTEAFARADQNTAQLQGDVKGLSSKLDTFLLLMTKGTANVR